MNKQESFVKNILYGLELNLKKIFRPSGNNFKIGLIRKKYLKHLPGNKIHKTSLLSHPTYFSGGAEYLHGITEIFVDKIYNQSLPNNSIIIDCGAHIGLSVIYLKNICPGAEIICFEPDKKNFEILKKNILSHNLEKVTAINKATWIHNEEICFTEEGSMSSKIDSTDMSENKVKASRLFDYLDRKIDFLKLDIEGAEYEVVKDIKSRLSNVGRLFIEYHGLFQQKNELIEILNVVSGAGFEFYLKEAASVYNQPFTLKKTFGEYDLQLNIFCFRIPSLREK